MTRIIYLNPFDRNDVSGGIKTAYRHVELLTKLGYDAFIWQPTGRATWFDSSARLIEGFSLQSIRETDVLVFPELLSYGATPSFVESKQPCTKLVFCQNQYYTFNKWIPRTSYAALGFRDVFCCSVSAKGFLEGVLGAKDVQIIPCFIDTDRFRPRPKAMQIAMVTRKMPDRASFIPGVFYAKYPDVRKVPFAVINNEHENKVAEILGQSTILLSLSNRESFGLVSVEAMAAGCLVAGYHGYGGLEYASAENGLWFGADEDEAVADALYRLVKGIEQSAPWVKKMLEDSAKVVSKYNRAATRDALSIYFARYATKQPADQPTGSGASQ